jgi:hypothetical protein
MEVLEKVLFWWQKLILKNLGEFYVETVNIKVVDNNLNWFIWNIKLIKLDLDLCKLFLDAP